MDLRRSQCSYVDRWQSGHLQEAIRGPGKETVDVGQEVATTGSEEINGALDIVNFDRALSHSRALAE